MRIAQVATLYETVPPQAYGGIERVVSYLTEELVRQGHDVTLFACGGSRTQARLIECCPCAVRLVEDTADPQAFHFAMLEDVVRRSADFDLAHFHVDYQHFPFSRRLACAHLTTLHWRLDIPGLPLLYKAFADVPVVSISDAQRTPLPWLNWQGTVHHGLPDQLLTPAELTPGDGHGGYLAFLGRIAPAKRPDLAIEIARRANVPLHIGAKIDNGDLHYFERDIRHLFDDPIVHYRGELNDAQKTTFLRGARGLVFPIDWPEPFGLVMAEALACGTPVIAFRRGSVPEVIEHGVTGFIVDTVDEAVEAVHRLPEIDRRACRATFEARFTASRMVADYLPIYERLCQRSAAEPIAPPESRLARADLIS